MPTVVAALALLLLPTPASAAPETTVGLDLARGPAVTGPHVEGTTLVDGLLRIPVAADLVQYVGKAGSAYVVTVDFARVLRIAPDGTTARLAKVYGYPVRLSDDGTRLLTNRTQGRTSTLTVRSALTGARIAQRTFRDLVSGLDVDGDRVLLGRDHRTALWDTATGATTVLSRLTGYEADLGADVVAAFDPATSMGFDDGSCTEMLRVSTGDRLGRMCDDLVLGFSPDGTRMVTTYRYLDGPISVVRARAVGGRVLGQYRSDRGLELLDLRWETGTALLMTIEGVRRAGTVRCTGSDCELAGPPVRTG